MENGNGRRIVYGPVPFYDTSVRETDAVVI